MQLSQFNRLLGEINHEIALSEDESALLQKVCDLTVQYTNVKLAWIGRPDDLGRFQVVAASGEIRYLNDIYISTKADAPEGQGPTGRTWRNKKAFYSNEITTELWFSIWGQRAVQFGLSTSAAIPIFRSGVIWAVATFYQGSGASFNPDEISIIEEIGRDISFALDHIDLKQKEVETQVFNEILLNNLMAGVNVMRYPERIIERVNDRMLELYCASSKEDLVNHHANEFYPNAEMFKKVGEFAKIVLEKGSGILRDVVYKRLDGSLIYIDLSGQKLPSRGGESERIVWTHVDVTERHKNEEIIRRLSENQKILLDNTVAGIIMVQYPERVITKANQGFLDSLGYTNESELLGKSTQEFFPEGESNERMRALSQEVLQYGSGSIRDLELIRKDGSHIYLDISGKSLTTDPDRTLIVWTGVDVTERRHLMIDLARQSTTDLLTGLPNRRALEEEMSRSVARTQRNRKFLAVCMIDLDGFKLVNDTYGHEAGDLVLQIIAQRLKNGLRKSDFVARLGGDEFVLLVENLDGLNALEIFLYKMGKIFKEPISLVTKEQVRIELSTGVSLYSPIGTNNPETLLRLADQALYESKAHKAERKNFWVIYGKDEPKSLRFD